MASYTYEIDSSFNFPNITVYKMLADGVHIRYKVVTNEGYVMYDTTEDGLFGYYEDGTPIRYYSESLLCPLTFFNNPFTYVAVLRSSVDENYICDVDDEHVKV